MKGTHQRNEHGVIIHHEGCTGQPPRPHAQDDRNGCDAHQCEVDGVAFGGAVILSVGDLVLNALLLWCRHVESQG